MLLSIQEDAEGRGRGSILNFSFVGNSLGFDNKRRVPRSLTKKAMIIMLITL